MTPFPGKWRAVLFDADGVIIRSLETHLQAWQAVFTELGITTPDSEILLREGESAPSTMATMAARAGLKLSGAEIDAWVEKKRTIYRSLNSVQLYPEIYPLLEQLRQQGKLIGLVTGSSIVNLKHVLTEADLALFDEVFTAENYDRGKPDPEPYSRGVDALGVSPAEALVIENAPLGIQAAVAAGIHCIALMTTLPESELGQADRVLADHTALSDYLVTVLEEER